MAVDQFLKIEGVDGEARDDKHAGEIDVLAWSWGASNAGTMHMGGGGGSGKANVQDLSVTKYVDKGSPVLLQFCITGEHVPSATLTVRKAGKNPLEYMIIKMKNVMVTSYQTGGSPSDEGLTENITLNFEEVDLGYQPQKADGSKDGGVINFAWNITDNVTV